MDTFYDADSDTLQSFTRRYRMARTLPDADALGSVPDADDADALTYPSDARDDDDAARIRARSRPWQAEGRDALTLTYPSPTHTHGIAGLRI